MNNPFRSTLSKQNIDRGISYLKRNGIKSAAIKAVERMSGSSEDKNYEERFLKDRPDDKALELQKKQTYTHDYKISILVPTYETDPEFFTVMVKSVMAQTYYNWELCIADASDSDTVKDTLSGILEKEENGVYKSRIKYNKLSENKGIASNTNAALEMATGEYSGLLDHDDFLEPDALYEIMQVLEKNLESDGKIYSNRLRFIYTDEDKYSSNGNRYFEPNIKPDFDIDLLRSNNYICHFSVFRTSFVKELNGLSDEYNGAQDHDLFLRITENIPVSAICHIPKVLYHWRTHSHSTAVNPASKMYAYDAGKRAVEAHLKRKGIKAEVLNTKHLGFFRIKYEPTDSSILSLSRSEWDELTVAEVEKIEEDYIFVLSDTLKPMSKDYLAELSGPLSRYDVGAVGGKIYDKRFHIESAGFRMDVNGNYIPEYAGLSGFFSGYMHRASIIRRVDALSLDCIMFRRSALDLSKDKPSFKDTYLAVFDPYAEFRRK